MDENLFFSGKNGKTIYGFIGNHFVFIFNGKISEIAESSIINARSNFIGRRVNSKNNKEIIKKLNTIIQSLSSI